MPQPDPFSTSPVLLGGENRSGTTLLSVVLDSHLDLVAGPEIDFLEPPNLGPHILHATDLLAAGDPRVTGTTKSAIDPFWYDGVHFVVQCRRFGLDVNDLLELVSKVMLDLGSDIVSLADRCKLINEMGELRRTRSGARRWGLKTAAQDRPDRRLRPAMAARAFRAYRARRARRCCLASENRS
ncbi:sulfotransferase [Bradyrhizobium sp. 2S1]|uniref:sulfotransferase n=1 Tax=Bradyrhizobium sp. 2S1 TaxID=1404429 RepID=UPI001CD149D0|nr:sulfotransferase [Bradyrhizobium sp. 2S1]MCK7667386.1 sulfotransferase [Bradyrhizobium sp. 2S1]